MIAMLVAWLLVPSAHATTMALEPQVRVHAGGSWVSGDAGLGVTAGFDARMTRLVAMDLGAFASPTALPEEATSELLPESARLRHGVYLTPGVRIPHPQPRSWAWELFLRAGGGVAWTVDASQKVPLDGETVYVTKPGMAGCGGADALVRYGKVGARVAARAWVFEGTQSSPLRNFTIVRPQITAEALVQW